MELSLSSSSATIAADGTPITSFSIKAGDTYGGLVINLLDNEGNVMDLTPFNSAQVVVAPEPDGRPIIDKAATVGIGKVSCPLVKAEVMKPGNYLVEVTLKTAGGEEKTIPGGEYGAFIITPRLKTPV